MRKRLDVLLLERGLAESRHRAQGLILAGAVRVEGKALMKAGAPVDEDSRISIENAGDRYVSRGARKLAAALDSFDVDVAGLVALDVGASTGGFTDVLLRKGASRVYAVDVGYGQLAWMLRQDRRVVVMERTNFRLLESLPETPQFAAVDVSFISLNVILPVAARILDPTAESVVLIKPQFEAGKQSVGKGGVVRDPAVHREVLTSVLSAAETGGWRVENLIESPLLGPAGNREFLAHLRRGNSEGSRRQDLVGDVLRASSPESSRRH